MIQMCGISARNGWFLQRMWPIIEGLLSKFVPAFFLFSCSLYGLYILHSIPGNSTSNLQVKALQSLAVAQIEISSLIVHVRSEENIEIVPQENKIERAIAGSSVDRHQRQTHQRECSAGIEKHEQLRVILLIALITSVAALQESATEFAAAVKPTFIGYSKREWLLVLLISHSLRLLVECVTLPLCLILSSHFRSHFSSLICFFMKNSKVIL